MVVCRRDDIEDDGNGKDNVHFRRERQIPTQSVCQENDCNNEILITNCDCRTQKFILYIISLLFVGCC